MPREFDQWGWTMEELAAFTAVRQLLLVPEKSFKPVGTSRSRSIGTVFVAPTLWYAGYLRRMVYGWLGIYVWRATSFDRCMKVRRYKGMKV